MQARPGTRKEIAGTGSRGNLALPRPREPENAVETTDFTDEQSNGNDSHPTGELSGKAVYPQFSESV
jgi:hypothetical protein